MKGGIGPLNRNISLNDNNLSLRDDQYSRCSFSMMVKCANDGLLKANDGQMLVNDGEMSV